MELKLYQQKVLHDLDVYIENLKILHNPGSAYNKIWIDKGVRVGGSNGIQQYKDVIPGTPSVCFKVPTGGGKTLIGCASLKHIFDKMSPDKKKVVVWLVPWDTILSQTYNNLKNPSHFYRQRLNRDFSSKVEIYNKQQVLNGTNFNPSAINDQLSIIIMSFDSLRARNKDDRRVYEENSNLLPFVSTYENRTDMISGVDETSLMQVLNQLRPVVIIDESHNAQSDLSKEMVKNLNPSFVVELTATPKQDSNIISIVTATELKEENMVKLPVIAYNRPTIDRVLMEALDLRKALETAAIKERRENGIPYIRPIILFQAQPNNDSESITFTRIKEELVDVGIPEEQIAIKTATINELNGVDLMSEDCKIRYIITINALKEGWDCPFAYILASLANRTSRVDVEQILGRVLRQPHQQNYQNKLLNMSYVFTSSINFQDTLDNILSGLNSAGFSKNDCRIITTNTIDNLNEERNTGDNEMRTIFDESNEDVVDISDSIFNIQEIQNELNERTANDPQIYSFESSQNETSQNDNINSLINQAETVNEQYEAEVEESQRDGTSGIPEEFRHFSNIFKVKNEFKDEIRDLRLPMFIFNQSRTLFENDLATVVDNEYLNKGFNLDTEQIPTNILSTNEDIYKVDVETTSEGNVLKKSVFSRNEAEAFKQYLNQIPESSRVNACKSSIVHYLNEKFDNISQSSIQAYIDRIFATFTTEDEIIKLQNNIFAIERRIKDFIVDLLEKYRYKNFKEKLISNEIFVQNCYKMNMSIILPNHTESYLRTLYEAEDSNVNSLELKFMNKISSLQNVKWWHRIVDRIEYSLNGYINHYPDFIVETESGVIILVETKGEYLDGDDSKKKLELGKLWSNYAGPNKFKYFMAFERTPLNQDGSGLLDDIIDLISRL